MDRREAIKDLDNYPRHRYDDNKDDRFYRNNSYENEEGEVGNDTSRRGRSSHSTSNQNSQKRQYPYNERETRSKKR